MGETKVWPQGCIRRWCEFFPFHVCLDEYITNTNISQCIVDRWYVHQNIPWISLEEPAAPELIQRRYILCYHCVSMAKLTYTFQYETQDISCRYKVSYSSTTNCVEHRLTQSSDRSIPKDYLANKLEYWWKFGRDLKRRIRKIPGVPIISVGRGVSWFLLTYSPRHAFRLVIIRLILKTEIRGREAAFCWRCVKFLRSKAGNLGWVGKYGRSFTGVAKFGMSRTSFIWKKVHWGSFDVRRELYYNFKNGFTALRPMPH